MENLLEIKDLKLQFSAGNLINHAVNGVNLSVAQGEVLVLAGESGSGKTVTALAVTNILPKNARILSGSVSFLGQDLLRLDEYALAHVRGRDIAYIFQEPLMFLNPVFSIGEQLTETICLHQEKTRKAAGGEASRLLELVKIKDPQRVFLDYPHQLSGGMNQRALIAMALACRPKLLIADEPTTSLDVTIEHQILSLLMELKTKLGFSLLFITHNLSIARRIADRICIMYQGRIVEEQATDDLFGAPRHAHTKELIQAYLKIGTL